MPRLLPPHIASIFQFCPAITGLIGGNYNHPRISVRQIGPDAHILDRNVVIAEHGGVSCLMIDVFFPDADDHLQLSLSQMEADRDDLEHPDHFGLAARARLYLVLSIL